MISKWVPWQYLVFRRGTFSVVEACELRKHVLGKHIPWALPGLPCPNMASLEDYGSRTITIIFWQSTLIDIRCFVSSGQHFIPGNRLSGSFSDSSRTVPPTHFKRIIGIVNEDFLTDSLAVSVTCSGRKPSRFLSLGIPYWPFLWIQPRSILDLKTETTATIKAVPREEFEKVTDNFSLGIQVYLQRRRGHFEKIF